MSEYMDNTTKALAITLVNAFLGTYIVAYINPYISLVYFVVSVLIFFYFYKKWWNMIDERIRNKHD